MRRLFGSLFAAALLTAPMAVAPAEVAAQQAGLVNVEIDDVEVLKNANVAAVVPVVVQACPNVDVDALVAALAIVTNPTSGVTTQTVDCDADSDVEIRQAAGPRDRGGAPAGR